MGFILHESKKGYYAGNGKTTKSKAKAKIYPTKLSCNNARRRVNPFGYNFDILETK